MKKILSYNCHEGLLTLWAKLGYEIDLLYYRDWSWWRTECRPIPENITLLSKGHKINEDDYFVAIAFNHHSQYKELKKYKIPIVISFATGKCNEAEATPENLKDVPLAFCSFSQKVKMGFNNTEHPVITYGIDTNEFKGYKGGNGKILTMNHDFRKRDDVLRYHWWKEVCGDLPTTNYGYQTDGLKCPHTTSYEEVKNVYRDYSVYMDTCLESPLSMGMLEAMATGMPVVTTCHDDMEVIISHKENGIICNDKGRLRWFLTNLLKEPYTRARLGKNARDMIKECFTIDSFKYNWTNYFKMLGLI